MIAVESQIHDRRAVVGVASQRADGDLPGRDALAAVAAFIQHVGRAAVQASSSSSTVHGGSLP